MFNTDDTIVAIATPPGRGGIGVVRLSGPSAAAIAGALACGYTAQPRHATVVEVRARDGSAIDQAVVTFFPAPHSYTGEDVVEISAHGSPVVLSAIVSEAIAAGARLATPGEFTFRAYLHGKIDLVQAEAVADLIDAVTPLQARVAFDQLEGTLTTRIREVDTALMDVIARLEASLDFPDAGYHFITPAETSAALAGVAAGIDDLLQASSRGRLIREGRTVAIIGPPNAGKSSLFNRLAGAARAIVTTVPGTTRDLVTERVDLHGVPFTLVDTAGLRARASDEVEEEGIARARQARSVADVEIVVLDCSVPLDLEARTILDDSTRRTRVIAANKADLPAKWDPDAHGALRVSALTGEGMAALVSAILDRSGGEPPRDAAAVANIRHAALLAEARDALARARVAAAERAPEEFVLTDLHAARSCFDEITGARTPDDVLRMIFDRFCIGK